MAPLPLAPLLPTADGPAAASWLLLCGATAAASAALSVARGAGPRWVQTHATPLPPRPALPLGAAPCKRCGGTARAPCCTCAGAGRLNSPQSVVPPRGEGVEWCADCRGTGQEWCPWCLGEGYRREIGFRS